MTPILSGAATAIEQFRKIGLPRCSGFGPGGCKRFIWPWQAWICEIEAWPGHHSCHHRYLAYMRAAGIRDGWGDSPDYSVCSYCDRHIMPNDNDDPSPPSILSGAA